MPIIYSAALKTLRMEAVRDALDGGSLEIGTAAMAVVLATIPLDTPSGEALNGVLTLAMPQTDPAAAATGTAAAARLKRADGSVAISGLTVGLSASDINLDDLQIDLNEPITIQTVVITHAP